MLESKRRGIIFLSLSFFLALVAGFFFLQKVSALNADLGGMTEIYVADADIASRAMIQPDQVTTMDIPNRFVTDSHITSLNELEYKVSVVPLSKGDIITDNMLKQVSVIASEGNRLVALVSSDKVGFDQDLEALDRVDIVVSHSFEDHPKTETFMKDVLVAMVAKEGILLEVPADEAPRLIHMQNYADGVRVLKANVGKNEPEDEADQMQQNAENAEQQVNDQQVKQEESEDQKKQNNEANDQHAKNDEEDKNGQNKDSEEEKNTTSEKQD